MTDEKKPMTATEFVERNRELKFAKGGRLYFDGGLLPGDDEINLMRVRESTFHGPEVVLPKDHPLASRMHRATENLTQAFVCTIKATDQVSGPMRKLMKQIEHTSFAAYYGRRIADLLTSDDPRQRKRGRRLRDQRFRVGRNFTRGEALALRDAFRDRHPELKSFWHDNLGEPYDPERYRKD